MSTAHSMQQAKLNAKNNFCSADGAADDKASRPSGQEKTVMNLEIWLPAMFLLGLTVMGLCYAFLIACEKI